LVHQRGGSPPQPQEHRARQVRRRAQRLLGLGCVGRHQHRHPGHGAHDGDVFHGMMGRSVVPSGQPAVRHHDSHRQAVACDVHLDLLARPCGREAAERVGEGTQPGGGHPRGHPDQVGLRDAHIDVLLRQLGEQIL
jgi:hypothetical protein